MSIELYGDSQVYVATPAGCATGGPQLLHQLVHTLRRDLGVNAQMFYYPPSCANPVHQAYRKYENPYVSRIVDSERNILIVPEIYSALSLLDSYRQVRKVIWWLSVDNFYASRRMSQKSHYCVYLIAAAVNKLTQAMKKPPVFDLMSYLTKDMKRYSLRMDTLVRQASFHFVQSHYAYRHLMEKGVTEGIYHLSDYLDEAFLATEIDRSKKQDIVAYNPAKGFNFTAKLIKSAPRLRFVPIQHMTREEVVRLLLSAKVYIDFGNHPGKDRIPREAAILGCCILTGKKGAAAFREDLNIPDEYKFDDHPRSIPRVLSTIEDCFAHFDQRLGDFDAFRRVIRKEPEKFRAALNDIFGQPSTQRNERVV